MDRLRRVARADQAVAAEAAALAAGRQWHDPAAGLPQARDFRIPGRGGEIRLRVLAPEQEAHGIYLHLHGGGWVLGDCDLQDPLLWELVQATGLCVVGVGYRLAPEHPYPARLPRGEPGLQLL